MSFTPTRIRFRPVPHARAWRQRSKFGRDLAERFSREGGQLEFEKICEPLFSHGKKKRYVGRMVWPQGRAPDPGYETRRTDAFDLQSEL